MPHQNRSLSLEYRVRHSGVGRNPGNVAPALNKLYCHGFSTAVVLTYTKHHDFSLGGIWIPACAGTQGNVAPALNKLYCHGFDT
jgi:hypothetical protein